MPTQPGIDSIESPPFKIPLANTQELWSSRRSCWRWWNGAGLEFREDGLFVQVVEQDGDQGIQIEERCWKQTYSIRIPLPCWSGYLGFCWCRFSSLDGLIQVQYRHSLLVIINSSKTGMSPKMLIADQAHKILCCCGMVFFVVTSFGFELVKRPTRP